MITYVGSENLSSFAQLLTPEAQERALEANTLIYGTIDDDTKLACGAAALAASQTQANLISLYVTPGHRLKGYGKAMLERLIEQALQTGILTIATAYELPAESSGPLGACLSAAGFEKVKSSSVYEAPLRELLKAKALMETAHVSGILPMSQVPKSWIFGFNQRQRDSVDFVFDPINPDVVDLELSTAIVADNSIRGGVWIARDGEEYTVEGLYIPKDYGQLLAPVLGRTLSAAEKLPKDTIVRFVAINPVIEKLLTRIFPRVEFATGQIEAMVLA